MAIAALSLSTLGATDTPDTPGRSAENTSISVTINGETALLHGQATSIDEAERHAAKLQADPSVRKLINRITISNGDVTDRELLRRVTGVLKDQALIEADRVKPVVSDRKAVLTGEIGSLDERDLAIELVSRVAGITEIEDRMEVTFDTIRTDAQISRQIEFLVADDPRFDGAEISAHVTDGIVRLSGMIGSRELWDRLVGRSYVTGVFAVEAHEVSINRGLAAESVARNDH